MEPTHKLKASSNFTSLAVEACLIAQYYTHFS